MCVGVGHLARVLLMSTKGAEVWNHCGEIDQVLAVLSKPFDRSTVLASVAGAFQNTKRSKEERDSLASLEEEIQLSTLTSCWLMSGFVLSN